MKGLNMLSVEKYDTVEREATLLLPNRITSAFRPATFSQEGYPSRVSTEVELWKYVDVMHELKFAGDFSCFLRGLTIDEFCLLQKLTKKTLSFCETFFDKKLIARSTVLRGMNILRHIRYMFGQARPRVLEIGPGSGSLGALLLLEGYPYAAMDISQAFYLYQTHFWSFVADGNIVELASGGDLLGSLTDIPSFGGVHIPWWEFLKLPPEKRELPRFDILICNHALCEMHPHSLGFTLRLAKTFLLDRDANGPPKVFMFEGWGAQAQNNETAATEHFYRSNFALIHNDPWITVFAPCGTAAATGHLSLPRKTRRNYLLDVIRILLGRNPNPNAVLSYKPIHYSSDRNPLSMAITSGRHLDEGKRAVTLGQVNAFYTTLLGTDDHSTEDERFMRAIGLKYVYDPFAPRYEL